MRGDLFLAHGFSDDAPWSLGPVAFGPLPKQIIMAGCPWWRRPSRSEKGRDCTLTGNSESLQRPSFPPEVSSPPNTTTNWTHELLGRALKSHTSFPAFKFNPRKPPDHTLCSLPPGLSFSFYPELCYYGYSSLAVQVSPPISLMLSLSL